MSENDIGMSAEPGSAADDVRRVALAFVDGLTGGAELDPAIIADTKIWVSGSKWWSGEMAPARAAEVQTRFQACFTGGRAAIETMVTAIACNERQAFIEVSQRGPWFDGRTYSVPFILVIDVADGRVATVCEYITDDEFFGRVDEGDTPAGRIG